MARSRRHRCYTLCNVLECRTVQIRGRCVPDCGLSPCDTHSFSSLLKIFKRQPKRRVNSVLGDLQVMEYFGIINGVAWNAWTLAISECQTLTPATTDFLQIRIVLKQFLKSYQLSDISHHSSASSAAQPP